MQRIVTVRMPSGALRILMESLISVIQHAVEPMTSGDSFAGLLDRFSGPLSA